MPYRDPAARADYVRRYQEVHREQLSARRRAHYAANRALEREQMRAYRAVHRDEAVARSRAFHVAHRVLSNERRRQHYAAHRDEVSARRREAYRQDPGPKRREVARWRHEQPTLAAALGAANSANRRARLAGLQGRITSADVIALWQRQPVCVDCGDGRGLDHVIPFYLGGTNTTGNLATRCPSCNSRKGRKLPEEMAA